MVSEITKIGHQIPEKSLKMEVWGGLGAPGAPSGTLGAPPGPLDGPKLEKGSKSEFIE